MVNTGGTALSTANTLSMVGMWSTIGGSLISGIGAFYSAQSQQDQIRANASSMRSRARIADRNARQAEFEAQDIMRSAQFEKGKLQLRGRQERGRGRASTAARGGRVGSGSAAEVEASQKLVQEIDEMTIDSNAARAAAGQRIRAESLRGEALLGGVSAANLERSAGTISPGLRAGTTLLGGAGLVSRQLADDLRFAQFANNTK